LDAKEKNLDLIDHLFRHESGKLVSVLTKILGTDNIDLAEDVVQDAMAEAIDQWAYKGVPENPTGWLYRVAKFKAINFIKREKNGRKYSSEVIHFLQSKWTAEPALDYFFSEPEIEDDLLRMMFTCCHPSISVDSQIALTLKTLCGFSVPEIANAFLTHEDSVTKRLVRARQTIRENKISFNLPSGSDFENRLSSVLEAIYLLFNEGYNASNGESIIRLELCEEAIRLTQLIADSKLIGKKNSALALLSLMLFNVSRFRSRQNDEGAIVELANQNRALWDKEMIQKAIACLDQSLTDNSISKYHIMATISAHHCTAADDASTDWKDILSLYNNLGEIDKSPLVLLNRAVAISKAYGAQTAIYELEKLWNDPFLNKYSFYYSTLAELYLNLSQPHKSLPLFEKAISFSHNNKELKHLEMRMNHCRSQH
jgi:RNA polymerase sigma factor (sigma-70 family)